ncbi:arylsulfatase [Flexithrix dorotheae]|uniref:arylsulfatase n=1 Tax=Flexithrix dorotheae TaxID=70993 RepID=UPI0005C661A8|nr:arylsulfatase [Flexithrix dorotheae]
MKYSKLTSLLNLFTGIFLVLSACSSPKEQPLKIVSKPNVIFVMVDDLGYGDLGSFGQQVVPTPNLDEMAAEGIRFTNCYSGSPVCAPARSTLMTGMHTGHTTVRGNKSQVPVPAELSGNPGRVPLNPEDITIAEVLKDAGYVTGITGKWGLGEPGSVGVPNEQGFDQWLGYLNQKRAHDHFIDYFWHNKDTLWLEGNDAAFNKSNVTFSHNLFTDFALDFIENNKDTSFFLYLPYCLPHDHYHISDEDLVNFKDKDWTENEKVYAAMVAKIDRDMGHIMTKIADLGLDENTMIFFCSDNGAARRWEGRFDSSGKLRGRKRDMYEGGIRTPMIVRMPGKVPAGVVSDYPWYFPDVLPTLAAFTGGSTPEGIDGINVLPEILGQDLPETERFMYWEFHEGGFFQAVRWKNWKAVREGLEGKLELYDLANDEAEQNNISAENPEVVKTIENYLLTARTKSPYWNPKQLK